MTLGPSAVNHLAGEKSPYLLQHVHNPVDWYPWGPEAFARASAEDKPVFLSIGYSTCHWCHVMERESFEDAEAAALLNRVFVCVKVDREERPDVDAVYMAVCQMMTEAGGWPLTIFMTADARPFFASTYLPKISRFGRSGIMELVPRVEMLWSTRRVDLLKAADQVLDALQSGLPVPSEADPGAELMDLAYADLAASFDARYGGFGDAPKFPMPHSLRFLMRYALRHPESDAATMVRTTLNALRHGGICDQVGFGFHRYSTDTRWHVPHFEKMLYDQALLALTYMEAFQITGDSRYRATAVETLDYVLRDLAHPDGGLYSAEDADSEGVEGKFYLWSKKEVLDLLGAVDGEIFCEVMHVGEDFPQADEAAGGSTGGSILHRSPEMHVELSAEGVTPAETARIVERGRRMLFETREKRIRPHRDDKILTDWNGLAIAALAQAGRAFGEPRFIFAAEQAAAFIKDKLMDPDGYLLHRWRDGEAGIGGFLDDYAFLTYGLMRLYEATGDVRRLQDAVMFTNGMIARFWDVHRGGFFLSGPDAGGPPMRSKELFDGALPSGNSVAMENLVRLGTLTGRTDFLEKAWALARLYAGPARHHPQGFAFWLGALDFALGPSREVVIVGGKDTADTLAMKKALDREFLPNAVVLFKTPESASALAELAPFTLSLDAIAGKATAYICTDRACALPATNVPGLLDRLRESAVIPREKPL